jgi:hypothetical protein
MKVALMVRYALAVLVQQGTSLLLPWLQVVEVLAPQLSNLVRSALSLQQCFRAQLKQREQRQPTVEP